jgi:hypothetical protein
MVAAAAALESPPASSSVDRPTDPHSVEAKDRPTTTIV